MQHHVSGKLHLLQWHRQMMQYDDDNADVLHEAAAVLTAVPSLAC